MGGGRWQKEAGFISKSKINCIFIFKKGFYLLIGILGQFTTETVLPLESFIAPRVKMVRIMKHPGVVFNIKAYIDIGLQEPVEAVVLELGDDATDFFFVRRIDFSFSRPDMKIIIILCIDSIYTQYQKSYEEDNG